MTAQNVYVASFICLLIPFVACNTPNQSAEIRERQLRTEEISDLQISSTKQTLVEGQRTRVSALAMVGGSVYSVTGNTEFSIEGPGKISRDDGKAYYIAEAPTGDNPSVVRGFLDPGAYGNKGKSLKSQPLNIFVVSEEDHGVHMPDMHSFQE